MSRAGTGGSGLLAEPFKPLSCNTMGGHRRRVRQDLGGEASCLTLTPGIFAGILNAGERRE